MKYLVYVRPSQIHALADVYYYALYTYAHKLVYCIQLNDLASCVCRVQVLICNLLHIFPQFPITNFNYKKDVKHK